MARAALDTEILVVGGGATGLGAAWDAALRGYRVLLVEKGDLAHGTSGRYHGLLHSGARYVVRDPRSAVECYHENLILKRILPSAIEDTGGFFAALPEDPPDYAEPFVLGCRAAGIPAEEISPGAARQAEPLLNPALVRVFRVPDAASDSFDASHALAEGIRAAGGQIRLRHKVAALILDGGRVTGAELENVASGERLMVRTDLVVNCTGAWAGGLAALAGCPVSVAPGKGTMIAMNTRLVNTVVNRLKPPSDGDILVPIGTVAVMGTTEVVVPNPDQYPIEAGEIELLLAEGEKLVPGFRGYRVLRAWAGVRPLFKDHPRPADSAAGGEDDSRLISRAHAVLDHGPRDGVEGFISVVGGKFTTFRLMAEQTLDLAGRKLGTPRPCLTAQTLLDPPANARFHFLGRRLAEAEARGNADIVCECELVTRPQVEAALRRSGSLVLNDLRRDLRLGMGPCQAGFCASRAAGILHEVWGREPAGGPAEAEPAGPASQLDVRATNSALLEFLQERWKGLQPVMWGANLRQLELDALIYRGLLGADRLPMLRDPEVYPTEKTA